MNTMRLVCPDCWQELYAGRTITVGEDNDLRAAHSLSCDDHELTLKDIL